MIRKRSKNILQSCSLERTEGIGINDAALIPGKTKFNEPDILYEDKGLEVGAVLRGTNTLIDIYEKEFLSKVSEAINGRIPDTMQIRLVMQDDRDTIEHTAIPDFQNYQHLPRYLDGIFVYRFENQRIQDKVVLNQKTRMRTKTFPKIKKRRENSKALLMNL